MKRNVLKRIVVTMAAVVFVLSGTMTAFAAESPTDGNSSGGSGTTNNPVTWEGTPTDAYCGTPTDAVDSIFGVVPVTSSVMADRLVGAVSGERYNLGVVPAGEVVSTNVFESAKASGAKVTINSSAGAATTWQFGTIQNIVEFNPAVYVSNRSEVISDALYGITLAEGTRYRTISFAHHGTLPATAEVTINLNQDALFVEGDTLYLYYLNPETNKFEFIDSAPFENHAGKFTMTHCSDYIVTTQPLPGAAIATAPKTGEGMNYGLYVAILVSGLGFLAIVAKNKKNA